MTSNKLFGISGYSGCGKTHLILRLLSTLPKLGLKVSTIKHAHHNFEIDIPGKDSFEHRKAGAHQVLVYSKNRWALIHETNKNEKLSLKSLAKNMTPVDLILVEGFKNEKFDKIEVVRSSIKQPLLSDNDKRIVAIVSDKQIKHDKLPVIKFSETEKIAAFIINHCKLIS